MNNRWSCCAVTVNCALCNWACSPAHERHPICAAVSHRKHELYGYSSIAQKWECKTTWKELFALISPYLLESPHDGTVRGILNSSFYAQTRQSGTNASMDNQLFQTIKIQLMALGLIDIQYLKTVATGMALFWLLTSKGRSMMMELRTVKRKKRVTLKRPLNKS